MKDGVLLLVGYLLGDLCGFIRTEWRIRRAMRAADTGALPAAALVRAAQRRYGGGPAAWTPPPPEAAAPAGRAAGRDSQPGPPS